MPAFGVSPAFVVSRHGPAFTPDDYCASATAARDLGFSAIQPEIYSPDSLPRWGRAAHRVAAHCASLGLACSQFVAHFLLENFSAADRLGSLTELNDVARAIAAARSFPDCRIFTVPIGAFRSEPGHRGDPTWYADQRKRMIDKLEAYLQLTRDANLRLALEILPFSLIGNADGFLRLTTAISTPGLGINLDTGHAWATREVLPLLPAKLHGWILGVHLKDGDGSLNQALAPGRGTIAWGSVLDGLITTGYSGSLDLEIGCRATEVADEYAFGLRHLKTHFEARDQSPLAVPA